MKGGMCNGSIYIDLVNIASESLCSYETLHAFCNNLYDILGKGQDEYIYVYISEEAATNEISINQPLEEGNLYIIEGDWDEEHQQYLYSNYKTYKSQETIRPYQI